MTSPSVTDWIQAMSAALGVIGLGLYALDTRTIRNESLAQGTANRRPSFNLEYGLIGSDFVFEVMNVGSGVALGAKWKFHRSIDALEFESIGDVAVGSRRALRISHRYATEADFIWGDDAIRLVYTDTAKKEYWSDIKLWREGQSLRYEVASGETTTPLCLGERLERWNKLLEGD
jgi:hypothetical protein